MPSRSSCVGGHGLFQPLGRGSILALVAALIAGLAAADQVATATPVRAYSGSSSFAAGFQHSLTVRSDGTVWASGYNSYGQLGNNTTVNAQAPVQVSGIARVIAVAGGGWHSLALKSDGTAWAWGSNTYGQLGDNTTVDRHTPVQVSGISGVTAVAGSDYYSLALKSDGTVWAWGYNGDGYLGDGTTVDKHTPVQVSGLTGVIAITAGDEHSMALKSDGTVWAWGLNAQGGLGDGTIVARYTPVQVSGLSGVTSIGAGWARSMALKSDGTVWAWGDNAQGQLGDGTTVDKHTPVQAIGLTAVTAIAAGGHFCWALKSDGTVWAWGSNFSGQLGDGTTTDRYTAVAVGGLTGVTAITAGGNHGLASKSDGTVWGWGSNVYGQLADNTTVDKHSPVQTLLVYVVPGQQAPAGGAPTPQEVAGASNPAEYCVRCARAFGAEPVDTASGNLTESSVDLSISGRSYPLALTRTYNTSASAAPGALGYGWQSNYSMNLVVTGTSPSQVATITQETGATTAFDQSGSNWMAAAPRVIATLAYNSVTQVYTFARQARETFAFNSAGQLVSMTDLNGYTTTLTYVGGSLSSVSDPAGRSLSFTWTGSRITTVTDANASPVRAVTYAYNDGNGNLTDVTDVNGINIHYAYDTSHRLLSLRDQRSNTVTNHYDALGRVDWQKDQLLRQTSFIYSGDPASAAGGTTLITDPKGNARLDRYQYGLRISSTVGYGSASAATTQFRYDPNTLALTAVADANGNVTTYSVDNSGNILTVTDPLGRVTTQTYNAFNQVLTTKDGNGVTTTLTYDAHGNLLTTSRPLTGTSQVQTTTNHYGDGLHPGDVTSVTDPDGKTATLTYDTHGDLASSADALGQTTTHTYNADGWVLTDVSPKGNVSGCGCAAQYTTAYSYVVPGSGTTDQWGDVQTVTDPVAHVTTHGYDADRNVTTLKDGTGNLTTYVFDAANQQTQVKRADTPQTTVTTDYNPDGTVLDQKDGKGNAIQTYGYNSLAQVTSVKDALGNETDFTYDGVGNQLSKQSPGGNCSTASKCTTRTYDVANELKSVTYSDSVTPNVTGILYDSDGQKTAWTDGSGAWTQVFDSLHRPTSVTEGASGTVAYVYNLRNLPTTITYPGGVHSVTETYDDAGRWTKVQDWNGNLTTIGYDVNSNLTTYTLPTATTVVDTMAYNKADQLTSITDKAGATSFYSASYTYNAATQLITDTSAPAAQAKFHYTALNQLCYAGSANSTSCPNAPTGSEPFAYDAADNLVKLNTTTQQFNAADQLCWTVSGSSSNACTAPPTGATGYSFDTNGNRTAQTPSAGAATCDSYDQANRLVKVTTGAGASCTSPTTVGTYSYDGSGLRMGKTVAGVSTSEAWDFSHGLPLLLEDKTSSTTVDYVFGPGGLPLEQIATATLWYHHDQLGSTRAITNASGVTQATYQYDPYGNLIASTGSVTNPFLYNGQYKDSESGLYYLRARYYDPATAQFLTGDPAVAKTHSPFGYVQGNPLNHEDPSGLQQYQKIIPCPDSSGKVVGTVVQTWDTDTGFVAGEGCGTVTAPGGAVWGGNGVNTGGVVYPADVNAGAYNNGPVVNNDLGNKVGLACGSALLEGGLIITPIPEGVATGVTIADIIASVWHWLL
jgi:RHS repeat-associated protein